MAKRTINLTDAEQKMIVGGELPPSVIKKVQTAMKPKSSRYGKNKGANFQKEIAQYIADLLEIEWDNQDDNSPIQARPMGQSGNDVILRGIALEQFNYAVECKAQESLSIPATIGQVKNNTKDGQHWLIFWKKKGFDKAVVIMDTDAFKDLYKREPT